MTARHPLRLRLNAVSYLGCKMRSRVGRASGAAAESHTKAAP